LIYGSCSSIAADSIEKKPLYHFHPGTNALSLGTVGCNFKCIHCQNYGISTAGPDFSYMQEITPEMTIDLTEKYNCQGIAYTYNEPTIWHEFTFDSAKLSKKNNLYTVYVTNGYISEDPLRELSSVLDAMNIDVKAFTNDFYKKVCKASLQPVLNTCVLAKELDIHIELTYLVIPGYNDSLKEVENFCKWVLERLGKDIPIHFSRFHPDHNLIDLPRTPMETMLKVYEIAKKTGILYCYLGNVPAGDYVNTNCPKCGSTCIERNGFFVKNVGLKGNKCSKCGFSLSLID
jgi:pyruvate formate lyase activating enzyme